MRRGWAAVIVLAIAAGAVAVAVHLKDLGPEGPERSGRTERTAAGSPAAKRHSAARVVEERRVGERRMELILDSPALGEQTKVRLILPPGWSADAGRTWPVLWLLHGGLDDYTAWASKTNVESLVGDAPVLVVMPDGGRCGSYSDWWNFGKGGAPRWETYHLTELRDLLAERYHAGDSQAIAGYSMGGQGAMAYAARHPGMFKAAASFSGALDTLYDAPSGIDAQAAVIAGTTLGCIGTDWHRLWGDPVAQQAIWRAHNPYDLAAKLRGTALYVAAGDGRFPIIGDAVEELAYGAAQAFVARLRELGIPVRTHFYNGRHTFSYWEQELHRAFPMLMAAIGVDVRN